MNQYIKIIALMVSFLTLLFFFDFSDERKVGAIVDGKWIKASGGRYKFDTSSGRLESGQYAKLPNGNITVNEGWKYNREYKESHLLKRTLPKWITGSTTLEIPNVSLLKEVNIIGRAWFDTCELPDGKRIEVEITKEQYEAYNQRDVVDVLSSGEVVPKESILGRRPCKGLNL